MVLEDCEKIINFFLSVGCMYIKRFGFVVRPQEAIGHLFSQCQNLPLCLIMLFIVTYFMVCSLLLLMG